MKNTLKRGESAFEGMIILAVLLVIIVLMPKGERQLGLFSPVGGEYVAPSSSPSPQQSIRTAPQTQYISLGSGNASYAYQPYEEYITIENRGNTAVDLTSWQLRNGKDKRPYYQGNTLQRFSADIALLPSFILEPGERAIVTTGRVGVQTPYKIENFKENMCTGYLEALPDYAFSPPLSQNCPRPSEEPGIENMDRQCRDFINYLSSCQTPQFEAKDSRGDPCETCIGGKRLTSVCSDFIKARFNYPSCVATHSGRKDYSGKT